MTFVRIFTLSRNAISLNYSLDISKTLLLGNLFECDLFCVYTVGLFVKLPSQNSVLLQATGHRQSLFL